MPCKQIQLFIPDTKPYDNQNTWYTTFAGTNLIPLVENSNFKRFWFTNYGEVGSDKNILFRFEVDDTSSVESDITDLLEEFSNKSSYKDYEFASDIGKGEGSRFLGQNNHHKDHERRGDIAFDFLHTSARLFLDCITGPDKDGYWKLEPETQSRFSIETSMEQFHHLFCNLTDVPTHIIIAAHPDQVGQEAMTHHEFKYHNNKDSKWKKVNQRNASF